MTTSKDRADLGFAASLDDFNPADWLLSAPTANEAAAKAQTKKAAAAAGFRSREPQPATHDAATPTVAVKPRPLRGRRTGRNVQLNLKATPVTIAAFCAVADRQGWGLGETLEHAVTLLEREFAADQPSGKSGG
jgi:hypothetical protein